MRDEHPSLVWETALPLFSRTMLTQWTLALTATTAFMAFLLGTLFAAQGDWKALFQMAVMTASIGSGLWLFGMLVMAILFRGRYTVRYTLSQQGLRCDTLDPTAKSSNRIAIALGILLGRSPLLGAGIIGVSRESEMVRWSGAFQARFDARRHSILLRNGWRTLLWVQCTPENYAAVAQHVRHRMQRNGSADRLAKHSPVPAYLGRSLLVLLACMPLIPLAEEFDVVLLLPIITLCFALAMVWLINLFAWVVLGSLGLQIALVIVAQFEHRQSFIRPGHFYRAYEVLNERDLELFLLAGIGIAILLWLCYGALRGRWLAALISDQSDRGDESEK